MTKTKHIANTKKFPDRLKAAKSIFDRMSNDGWSTRKACAELVNTGPNWSTLQQYA